MWKVLIKTKQIESVSNLRNFSVVESPLFQGLVKIRYQGAQWRRLKSYKDIKIWLVFRLKIVSILFAKTDNLVV